MAPENISDAPATPVETPEDQAKVDAQPTSPTEDTSTVEPSDEAVVPHVVPGVDGGELHITKDGDVTTVEIVDGGEHADSIEVETLAFEGAAAAAAPTNDGESLATTPTNPTATPDQPGVEPGQGADDTPSDETPAEPPAEGAPNAPASTDPGGDTAQQNAPDAPAPEPDGPNVATNPGTESESASQTEAPESPAAPEGTPEGDGSSPPVQAAGEASEKPLYNLPEGQTEVPNGYTDSGLVTPSGVVLYHYDADTAGEPHTGDLPVYADDAPVVAPQEG